jgi:uncharacterized membrane protein
VQGVTRAARKRDESGQLTVLVVGFMVLCLLLAGAVTGASAVYLEHKRLLSVADAAAQAAADSFTLADSVRGPEAPVATLRSERVRGVVNMYLERGGASARFEELTVAAITGSPDGKSAQVTLSAVVRIPIVADFLPEGVRVDATSTARAQLTR